jgi:hypothetical protein
MNKELKPGSIVERGSRFFRNVHWAIGSVALGASLFVESAILPAVALFEFGHAAVLEGLHRVAANKKSPKAAPA